MIIQRVEGKGNWLACHRCSAPKPAIVIRTFEILSNWSRKVCWSSIIYVPHVEKNCQREVLEMCRQLTCKNKKLECRSDAPVGHTDRPIKLSPIIPAHTLIRNWCWCMHGWMPWGLLNAQMWVLWKFKWPSFEMTLHLWRGSKTLSRLALMLLEPPT